MKKTITLLLTLCLLLGLLPTEAVAFAGDIYRAGEVKTVKMADGSLSLQNGYVHVTLHKLLETYSYLTVVPAAKPDEDFLWNSQTPRCNYTTYNQGVPTTEGVVTELKSMTFVSETPNGKTNAIKAEYDLLSSHSHVAAQVTVYYEIVQLKERGTAAKEDTWGVLASVGSIRVDRQPAQRSDPRLYVYMGVFFQLLYRHGACLHSGKAGWSCHQNEPDHRAGGGKPRDHHRKLGIHLIRGGSAHKDRSQGVFRVGRCGWRLHYRGLYGRLPLGQSICGVVGLL